MLTWKDVINFSVKGNPKPDRRVEKTEAEWKEILTPEQYRITRLKGTEMAHSGALCSIYDAGQYNCVCCDTPLFDSTIKYDSSSGWPSFTQPIKENAIKYIKDSLLNFFQIIEIKRQILNKYHTLPEIHIVGFLQETSFPLV